MLSSFDGGNGMASETGFSLGPPCWFDLGTSDQADAKRGRVFATQNVDQKRCRRNSARRYCIAAAVRRHGTGAHVGLPRPRRSSLFLVAGAAPPGRHPGRKTRGAENLPQYIEYDAGGRPRGGLLQMDDAWKGIPPQWAIYLMAGAVDETVEKAKSLGGPVKFGPFDAAGVGIMTLKSN